MPGTIFDCFFINLDFIMSRYERFTMAPRALSPQYKNQQGANRMTAFDHQRLAMARLKLEESARIKNAEELHADLFDFNQVMDVDEYGFPLHTPYEIPDSVPSVYIPPTPETAPQQKENSVSDQGSSANPDSGTE